MEIKEIAGDQKFPRSGEVRRSFGISTGAGNEVGSFGFNRSMLNSISIPEELKPLKRSFVSTPFRTRERMKRLNESLLKLNNSEILKKQQGNEMPSNERAYGSSILKVGIHLQRSPSNVGPKKSDDRNKKIVLNKKIRSSLTDMRFCNTTPHTRQLSAMGKNRDMVRDGEDGFDSEYEFRKIPVGAEGWDKKMKRKRSVGSVSGPPAVKDIEAKRFVSQKGNSQLGGQIHDCQSIRSGLVMSSNGMKKGDDILSPVYSSNRSFSKNDLNRISVSRDALSTMSKEKSLPKANSKLNVTEDSHKISVTVITKGNASRASRSGPVAPAISFPNDHHASTGLGDREQVLNTNRIGSVGGQLNRKRSVSAGLSSPMAQWAGQRPHKISRTRRTNVLSPISFTTAHGAPESGRNSDITAHETLSVPCLPHIVKDSLIGKCKSKVTNGVVTSLSGISESKDIASAEGCNLPENKFQALDSDFLPSAKNQILVNKVRPGEGFLRQGRTSCGANDIKPLKNSKLASDKNLSKTSRSPKKISERKGGVRLAQLAASDPSTAICDSSDDQVELMEAANMASIFRRNSCSGLFWKKFEPFFTPVSLHDLSYLKQQSVRNEEEQLVQGSGDCACDSIESNRNLEESHGDVNASGFGDNEEKCIYPPLYQRVLSALILEGDYEEFGKSNIGKNNPMHYTNGSSLSNIENHRKLGYHNTYDECMHKGGLLDYRTGGNPCEGIACDGRNGDVHSMLDAYSRGASRTSHRKFFCCPYDQVGLEDKLMMELQIVGLYPEVVPDLADRDSEAINEEIGILHKRLNQLREQKNLCLNKLKTEVEGNREFESETIEEIAMDRLVELAYKKHLATRGNCAIKLGMPKVPKHVSQSFTKRTLSRCRLFEESGRSCFSKPELRGILRSATHFENERKIKRLTDPANEPLRTLNSRKDDVASGHANVVPQNGMNNIDSDIQLNDQNFAKTGPRWNRVKKKEVLLDNVGGLISFGHSSPGGIKGKRSERDKDKHAKDGAKSGRGSQSNIKIERKTRSKTKQRTSLLSSPEDGSSNLQKEGSEIDSTKTGIPGIESSSEDKLNSAIQLVESSNLPDLDIELSGSKEFDGSQDLSSWLDADGLPDNEHDFDLPLNGLEIPMDDLTDVYL